MRQKTQKEQIPSLNEESIRNTDNGKNLLKYVLLSGWKKCTVGELAHAIGSGTTPSRKKESQYYHGGTVPWVKTADLTNGEIRTTSEMVTNQAVVETALKLYPVETVLIAMYGGFNQIGRTGILRECATVNQAIIAIQVKPEIVYPEFLLVWLNFKRTGWREYAASSRKDPNITSSDVRAFPVLLPPLAEQRKIAEILSTWDTAIHTTEQLLEAKQQLKKGLMQRLLTGKLRFREFEGEVIEEKKLGEIGLIKSGGTPDTKNIQYWNGDIAWITPTDITRLKGKKYIKSVAVKITEEGVQNSSAFILPERSLIVCTRATIGECVINIIPVATNQGFKSIIPSPSIDVEYLYYWILYSRYSLMSVASGSTFLEVSKSAFENLSVAIPPLPEQQKIASVLSSCDREIALLREQLEQYKQQKKGLMQQLLTGRVRVGR